MYSQSEVVRWLGDEVGQQVWDGAVVCAAHDYRAYTRGEYVSHYGFAIGQRLWSGARPLSNAVHLVTIDGSLFGGADADRLVADLFASSEGVHMPTEEKVSSKERER